MQALSFKIDVQVLEGGRFVKSAEQRPVRRTADGRPAVVFRSMAWPVTSGASGYEIDISGVSFAPADLGYWPHGEPLFHEKASHALVWSTERTRYADYVVLDGDESDLERVCSALDQSGLTIIKTGRSWREASDGHHYDWFIRVGGVSRDLADVVGPIVSDIEIADGSEEAPKVEFDDLPPDEKAEALGQALQAAHEQIDRLQLNTGGRSLLAMDWEPQNRREATFLFLAALLRSVLHAERSRIADLQASLDEAELRSRELDQSYREAVHELSELQSRNKKLVTDIETEKALRPAISQLLKSRYQRLIDQLGAGASPAAAGLQKKLIELQEENDALVAENEQLSIDQKSYGDGWSEAEEKREEAEKKLQLLQQDLEAARRDLGIKRTKGGQGPERFIGQLLDGFSRITFVDPEETPALIAECFPKPYKLLELLMRLEQRLEIKADNIEGHKGWREIRNIATGDRNATNLGRIYFKSDDTGLLVAVHRKVDDKEQQRFLRRLPQ